MRSSRLAPFLALMAAVPGLFAQPSAAAPQDSYQESYCPGCEITGALGFADAHCVQEDGLVRYAWALVEVTARRGRCRLITGPYPVCIPGTKCSVFVRTEQCTADPNPGGFPEFCYFEGYPRRLECGESATFTAGPTDCDVSASATVTCTPCAD